MSTLGAIHWATSNPLGTRRTDVLVQASEDLGSEELVLWDSKRPYCVRKATARRKGCAAGVTLTWAGKGQRLWIRVNGPGTVRT